MNTAVIGMTLYTNTALASSKQAVPDEVGWLCAQGERLDQSAKENWIAGIPVDDRRPMLFSAIGRGVRRLLWRLQARLATSGLLEDSVLWEKMPRSIWNDECAPSIRTLVVGVVASFLRSGSLKSSMKQRGRIKGAEGDLMES